jgi:hypothetical protein
MMRGTHDAKLIAALSLLQRSFEATTPNSRQLHNKQHVFNMSLDAGTIELSTCCCAEFREQLLQRQLLHT